MVGFRVFATLGLPPKSRNGRTKAMIIQNWRWNWCAWGGIDNVYSGKGILRGREWMGAERTDQLQRREVPVGTC